LYKLSKYLPPEKAEYYLNIPVDDNTVVRDLNKLTSEELLAIEDIE
jgi:hypothetical protein